MVKYSISTNRLLLSSTCFGGFAAEKVPRTTGILFTFFRSHCIRLKTTSFEISSFEYLNGSVIPWYWNPSDSQACSGWILLFIQSNTTTSPVNIFCLKMAIRSSSSKTRLSLTGFLFHSSHWIGGPWSKGGKLPDWFSTKNHLGFHSITLLLRL